MKVFTVINSKNCLCTPILSAIGEPIDYHSRTLSASRCCFIRSVGRIPVQSLDVTYEGWKGKIKNINDKVIEINSSQKDKMKHYSAKPSVHKH